MKYLQLFKTSFVRFFLFLVPLLLTTNAYAASLSVSPGNITVTNGQEFQINVVLDTQGADIVAVDAIIDYDPSMVEIVSITQGSIFSAYPVQTFANGEIRISALDSTFSTPYNGSGTLATVRARGLQVGTTSFNFVFTSGSTTDSNVVEEGTSTDLLGETSGSVLGINTLAGGDDDDDVLPETAIFGEKEDMYILIGLAWLTLGTAGYLYRNELGDVLWGFSKNRISNLIKK
ncbi:MAG TPA: cohesin domain-containing protein [Candidatus Dojkabacteria bacterium]|nr:cohesin domain-containing protein [Candidatus Dojkabacteria bacterium]